MSHVIEGGTVKPSPKLCKTIQALPYPTTVKEVQTFIGMVQYFALYIPMLAEYKAKLTELTLKDANFNELWSDDHKKACDMIKNLLQDSILYIIDWEAELWLVTDASGHGLGGCLLMKKRTDTTHSDSYQEYSPSWKELMKTENGRLEQVSIACSHCMSIWSIGCSIGQ